MTDFNPNATGDTGAGGAGEAEPALHESWVKAFDDAGIPDLMRKPLADQIRRSEAAANKRIEELSQRQMPEDWAELYQQAQAAGITPQQFVEDYNGARGIQADPVGFMVAMRDQIDAMVARGEMTAYEGYQAKQNAAASANGQAAADGEPGWESPQDAELRQLREQLAQVQQGQTQFISQQQQREQQQQEAWEAQQAEAYASQAADQLIGMAEAAGFSREDQQSLQVIGAIASSYIEQGLPVDQAFQQAVNLAAARVAPAGGQPQRAQQGIPPIGAGTPGAVAGTTEGAHFANDRERAAAMVAAGKAITAQG